MVEHYWPTSLEEAVTIMGRVQATPYAGGTGLMAEKGKERSYLFLSRVVELQRFSADEDAFHVGAGLTFERLLEKHNIPQALRTVAAEVAAPALRSQATVGGTLMTDGPGSDLALTAMACDGELRIEGPNGARTVPVGTFFRSRTEVDLSPRELVAELVLPRDKVEPFYFKKACDGLTISVVLRWDGDRVSCCSAAFGGENALRRPELDKTLLDKTRGEVEQELPAYISAWDQAISAGRDGEDWLAVSRKGLLREFWEEQGFSL